jgi:hypothetical protein
MSSRVTSPTYVADDGVDSLIGSYLRDQPANAGSTPAIKGILQPQDLSSSGVSSVVRAKADSNPSR